MRNSILFLFLLSNINATFISDQTELANQVVYDTTTKLMWQDNNDITNYQRSWNDAINYCEALTKKSFTNWRLPNINELESIVDDSTHSPAINNTFLMKKNEPFWSSTTYKGDTSMAWYIDFDSGKIYFSPKSSEYRVRCVRDTE